MNETILACLHKMATQRDTLKYMGYWRYEYEQAYQWYLANKDVMKPIRLGAVQPTSVDSLTGEPK